LIDDTDNRIVARQLKHSLLNYMNSDEFNPENQVELSDLAVFFYQ